MLKSLMILLLAAGLAAGCSGDSDNHHAGEGESDAMNILLQEYFEERLQLEPLLGTMIGDPRYNGALPNYLSPAYHGDLWSFNQNWLAAAQHIDRGRLGDQERISRDIFIYEREQELEGLQFPGELLPLDQFNGFPAYFAEMGSGMGVQPFNSERDYRDFLVRIDDAVILFEQMISNMREGMKRGIVQPKVLMEKVLPQLAAHIVANPEDSVFYYPVATFPDGVRAGVREELRQAYLKAIRDRVVPAFTRLHTFVRDEYLPACRDSVGWSALPGGVEWYASTVRRQTTTGLTPEEIHQIGLAEVAQLTAAMEEVRKEVGFAGTLVEFFAFMKNDERFYYANSEDLLDGFRTLQAKINAALPQLFDLLPNADYQVVAAPDYMAESAAGAYYYPGTADGSRPARFYVNTFNLRAQPIYSMETLSLHEASPGHHFQYSIAQELETLPAYRRYAFHTAFVEGWALYAETLGRELGLFSDPYSYYGHLSDQMLRAMRLVVDTGLHAKGWTHQQAIDYMLANSSMVESDVVAEVERYIAWPGQALAYKIGQREIAALRAEAEARLGERFDLKAFHRLILSNGSLPLTVLRGTVAEWIALRRS